MNEKDVAFKGLIAQVAVDKTLYSYDMLYEYYIPPTLASMVEIGMRVIVPFGKGNKKQIALVMDLKRDTYYPSKTKRIIRVIDDGIKLSREMIFLVKWVRDNTFSTYFDVIKSMLPTGLSIFLEEQYSLTKGQVTVPLTTSEERIYNALRFAKSKREIDACLDYYNDEEKEKAVKSLIDKGVVVVSSEARHKIQDETVQMAELSPEFIADRSLFKLTPKQRLVVSLLEQTSAASFKEICYTTSVTTAVIKNLIKSGVVVSYPEIVFRGDTSTAQTTENLDDLVFSPEQQEVFDGLNQLMNEDSPQCALLHGVTGSGKTSIFIKLIEETLNQGKTAIMLVPEIALTPQMVGKFQSLFGNKVGVIHSNLSLGQRNDEYKRIAKGDATIVIGTRSAIFAPLDNIGIIIMDEEGEHTYKSEKSPRYHARDVAKQRCFYHKGFLLLASATPSLESYYYGETGRYHLFQLNNRYKNSVLPDVYMVDMKIEAENGNRTNFSEVLIHELRQNLDKGEQSLILLNRRGYHTHTSCMSCGYVEECPTCGIPLTYHKINNNVICHYCGYTTKFTDECSKCSSGMIKHTGTGTQRIEEEIQEFFPTARILRMDADTTMTKNAYDLKFSDFGKGEYDIMVGTQMIAKGLDFPNVTLVGVLMIDKSLYAGDYLGYEKTFSLVTQVVGRSGRGEKSGRAYLQTFTPEHYVLNLAANQNYIGFYQEEIQIRKALIFPPFCSICVIGFSSLMDNQCLKAATSFAGILKDNLNQLKEPIPIRVLGPAKSGLGKINGRFRYRIILKCKNSKTIRKVIEFSLKQAYRHKDFAGVSIYADMNGEIS